MQKIDANNRAAIYNQLAQSESPFLPKVSGSEWADLDGEALHAFFLEGLAETRILKQKSLFVCGQCGSLPFQFERPLAVNLEERHAIFVSLRQAWMILMLCLVKLKRWKERAILVLQFLRTGEKTGNQSQKTPN